MARPELALLNTEIYTYLYIYKHSPVGTHIRPYPIPYTWFCQKEGGNSYEGKKGGNDISLPPTPLTFYHIISYPHVRLRSFPLFQARTLHINIYISSLIPSCIIIVRLIQGIVPYLGQAWYPTQGTC